MAAAQNLRATGDRIEQLLDELRGSADPRSYRRAEELLRIVTELYGAGLARIVEIAGERSPGLMEALVEDDLVASLLLVHELHPESLISRVEMALGRVRPLLARHDGDVELLDVDEEAAAVRIRLLGSCDGCPSSAITLRPRSRRPSSKPPPRSSSSTSTSHRWRVMGCPWILGPSRYTSNARRRWPRRERSPRRAAAHSRHPAPRQCRARRDLRYVPRADTARARARRRSRGPTPPLRLPGLPSALHFGGRRGRPLPGRSRSISGLPRLRAVGPAVGLPANSRECGLLLRQLDARPGGGLLSRSGRCHRIASATRDVGGADIVQSGTAGMLPDVEAFLVRIQPDRSGSECYVVPIDVCYELVGRLRQLWRGFDGGQDARDAIDGFFAEVKAQAR